VLRAICSGQIMLLRFKSDSFRAESWQNPLLDGSLHYELINLVEKAIEHIFATVVDF
jgi:hypothetical protein